MPLLSIALSQMSWHSYSEQTNSSKNRLRQRNCSQFRRTFSFVMSIPNAPISLSCTDLNLSESELVYFKNTQSGIEGPSMNVFLFSSIGIELVELCFPSTNSFTLSLSLPAYFSLYFSISCISTCYRASNSASSWKISSPESPYCLLHLSMSSWFMVPVSSSMSRMFFFLFLAISLRFLMASIWL